MYLWDNEPVNHKSYDHADWFGSRRRLTTGWRRGWRRPSSGRRRWRPRSSPGTRRSLSSQRYQLSLSNLRERIVWQHDETFWWVLYSVPQLFSCQLSPRICFIVSCCFHISSILSAVVSKFILSTAELQLTAEFKQFRPYSIMIQIITYN